VSLGFVAWAYGHCRSLGGSARHARDQLVRASQSIPLNIAEGNGKLPSPDRLKSLRIALGSVLECGAILDVLRVCGGMTGDPAMDGKRLLGRVVAMLTRMTRENGEMKDEAVEYECEYEYDYRTRQGIGPRRGGESRSGYPCRSGVQIQHLRGGLGGGCGRPSGARSVLHVCRSMARAMGNGSGAAPRLGLRPLRGAGGWIIRRNQRG